MTGIPTAWLTSALLRKRQGSPLKPPGLSSLLEELPSRPPNPLGVDGAAPPSTLALAASTFPLICSAAYQSPPTARAPPTKMISTTATSTLIKVLDFFAG